MKKKICTVLMLLLGVACGALFGCANLSARYSLDRVLSSFSRVDAVNFNIITRMTNGLYVDETTINYIVIENDGELEMYAKQSLSDTSYFFTGNKLFTVRDGVIVDSDSSIDGSDEFDIFNSQESLDGIFEMRPLLSRLKYKVSMDKIGGGITDFYIRVNSQSFVAFLEDIVPELAELEEYIDGVSIILRVDEDKNRLLSLQYFISGKGETNQMITASIMLKVITYDHVSIDYPPSVLFARDIEPIADINDWFDFGKNPSFYFSRYRVVGDLMVCLGGINSGMPDYVYVYNLKTQQIIYEEYIGYDYFCSIDSDGEKMIVSNRERFMIYDLSDMTKLCTFEAASIDFYELEKRIVCVVIEGDRVLFGCDYQVSGYVWENATLAYDIQSGVIHEATQKSILVYFNVQKIDGKIYYQTTFDGGKQRDYYFDINSLEEGFEETELIGDSNDFIYNLIRLNRFDKYELELVSYFSNLLDYYRQFEIYSSYFDLVYVDESYCVFVGANLKTIIYSFSEGVVGFVDFDTYEVHKLSDGSYVLLTGFDSKIAYLNLTK